MGYSNIRSEEKTVVIYETEEQQVEALKRWWQENGTSLIAGVIAALIIIGGWNYWKSYQEEQRNQASALYTQLLEDSRAGKHEAVDKLAKRLSEQYGSSSYASFAALALAKSQVQQGQLDEAKKVLEQLLQNAGSAEIKDVARVRLVRLMSASGEYEQGLKLIAEAAASASDGFAGIYDELTGDLYVALGRLGEARTAYQSALRKGLRSPLLQFKLDDITAADVVAESAPQN